MTATAVTLNDLGGHSQVADLFNAIHRTFVQHSTRFQLTTTLCYHGSSALAELLVSISQMFCHQFIRATSFSKLQISNTFINKFKTNIRLVKIIGPFTNISKTVQDRNILTMED